MKRNLKALGLLAFAAFAMSAMFASAASAQKGIFTAGDTNPLKHTGATFVGEQYDNTSETWNLFKTNEGEFRCDGAKFTGTDADGTATSVTVTAQYIHCRETLFNRPVTVTMNGCDYVFTQPTTEEGLGENEYTSTVDLTCPEGKKIVVHAYGFGNATNTSHFFNVCTIEVWPKEPTKSGGHETQQLEGHAILKNDFTGPDDVTAKVTVNTITYKDGCNSDEGENAEYKQTVTVKAFDDRDDSPNPTEHTEQLDAWISEEEA